jgi:hypothetical protein
MIELILLIGFFVGICSLLGQIIRATAYLLVFLIKASAVGLVVLFVFGCIMKATGQW